MISFIVCSRKKEDATALKQNLKDTVGLDFEFIAIDNSENRYSIFSAYNLGARQAVYPLLVFVHEDVHFRQQGWGQHLLRHFYSLPQAGIIGIAGSKYMPRVPSGWFLDCLTQQYNRLHILQGSNGSFKSYDTRTINPGGLTADEVVVLDGVFLAMRKETWAQHPFDEDTFQGFHFYDLDICLQAAAHKRNYVVYDIELIHSSTGKNDRQWLEQAALFHKKWAKQLPVYSALQHRGDRGIIEWMQFFYYLKLLRLHAEHRQTLSAVLKTAPWRYFHLRSYVKVVYYLVFKFP